MPSNNFAALGFGFSAHDKGLTKTQNKVSRGFDDIDSSMGRATKGATRFESSFDKLTKRMGGGDVSKGIKTLDEMGASLMRIGSRVVRRGLKETRKSVKLLGRTWKVAARGASALDKAITGKLLGGMRQSIKVAGKLTGWLGSKLPGAFSKLADLGSAGAGKLSKSFDGGSKSIMGMGESVKLLKKILTQAKLQTFVQSFGLSKLQGIAQGLSGIAKQGRNLTNSLEGQMVSMSTEAKKLGANYGFTGKALKKFTGQAASMADSLNSDVATTGKALRGFAEAGTEMEAMGFKTAKSFAKFAISFGGDSDLIRNQTMRMTREMGLAPKEMAGVVSSLLAVGQQMGDVGGTMGKLGEVTDVLSKRKMLGDSPEDLEKYGRGISTMAAGFFAASQDSDKAIGDAIALAAALNEGKKGFSDMLSGTAEFPDMLKDLAITTGQVETLQDALNKSPDEFAMSLAGMVDTSKMSSDQVQNFRARLSKSMGESGEQLFKFVDGVSKGGKATKKAMKEVKSAEKDLGKLANQTHSTGRTLQETFERAEMRFETSFRRIGKKHAREFVRDTSKEFSKFTKTMNKVVDEGGPMAALVTKMSEAHSLGAMAFIPKTLRPMAAVMGKVGEDVVPVVTGLGALGLKFKHLANPITLVTGGLLGLGLAFHASEKAFKGSIDGLAGSSKAMKREGRSIDKLEAKLRKMEAAGMDGTDSFKRLNKQLKRRKATKGFADSLRSQNGAVSKQTKSLRRLEKKRDRMGKSDKRRGALEAKIAKTRAALGMAEQVRAKTRISIGEAARKASQAQLKAGIDATVSKVKGFVKAIPMIVAEVGRFFREEMGPIMDTISQELEPMVSGLFAKVKSLPYMEYAASVGSLVKSTFETGFTYLEEIKWGAIFQGAIDKTGNFMSGLLLPSEGEKTTLEGEIGTGISGIMTGALGVAWEVTKAGVGAWWGTLWSGFDDVKLVDFLSFDGWKEKLIPAVGSAAKVLGATLIGGMLLIGPFRRKIASAFGSVFGSVFKELGGKFNKELWPSDKRAIKKDLNKNIEEPMEDVMKRVARLWGVQMKKQVDKIGDALERASRKAQAGGGGGGFGGGAGVGRRGAAAKGRRGGKMSRRDRRAARRSAKVAAKQRRVADKHAVAGQNREQRKASKQRAASEKRRQGHLDRAAKDDAKAAKKARSLQEKEWKSNLKEQRKASKVEAKAAKKAVGGSGPSKRVKAAKMGGAVLGGGAVLNSTGVLDGFAPSQEPSGPSKGESGSSSTRKRGTSEARAAKHLKVPGKPKVPKFKSGLNALGGGKAGKLAGKVAGKVLFALEISSAISGGLVTTANKIKELEKAQGRSLKKAEIAGIMVEETTKEMVLSYGNTPAALASLVPEAIGGKWLEKALTIEKGDLESGSTGALIKTVGKMTQNLGETVGDVQDAALGMNMALEGAATSLLGQGAGDFVSGVSGAFLGGESAPARRKREAKEKQARLDRERKAEFQGFKGQEDASGRAAMTTMSTSQMVERTMYGDELGELVTLMRAGDMGAKADFSEVLGEMQSSGLLTSKDVEALISEGPQMLSTTLQEYLGKPLEMLGEQAGAGLSPGMQKSFEAMLTRTGGNRGDVERMAFENVAARQGIDAGGAGSYDRKGLHKLASGKLRSDTISQSQAAGMLDAVSAETLGLSAQIGAAEKARSAGSSKFGAEQMTPQAMVAQEMKFHQAKQAGFTEQEAAGIASGGSKKGGSLSMDMGAEQIVEAQKLWGAYEQEVRKGAFTTMAALRSDVKQGLLEVKQSGQAATGALTGALALKGSLETVSEGGILGTAEDWTTMMAALEVAKTSTGGIAANMGAATLQSQGLFSVFSEDNQSKIGGFFSSLWGGIGGVGGFFTSLEGKVDDLFGHSISSDVEADFTKSSGTITEFLGELETGLKDTVQKAMVVGFKESFGKVDDETATFADRQLAAYEGMAGKVTDVFGGMWAAVLEMTGIASEAIDGAIEESGVRLRDLTTAVGAAESLSTTLGAAEVQFATPVVPEAALKGNVDDLLLKAVHYPLWYTKLHGPMTAKLVARVEALNATMKQRPAAAAAPRRSTGARRTPAEARSDLLERMGQGGRSNSSY